MFQQWMLCPNNLQKQLRLTVQQEDLLNSAIPGFQLSAVSALSVEGGRHSTALSLQLAICCLCPELQAPDRSCLRDRHLVCAS